MAAYAALVSLLHIIKQIQRHPHLPIFLDGKQIESLTQKVTCLKHFLEDYSHDGDDVWAENINSRIVVAAYGAEDVIESHILDQILGRSNINQDLQKVIEDMDSLNKEVKEIGYEKMRSIPNYLRPSSLPEAASSRLSPSTRHSPMVGFDDVLEEIMDKLTRMAKSNRQIIPIVGMGGMGKSTLAQNVYAHSIIMHHFDIRAWATISQVYNVREILLQLLLCFRTQDSRESLSQLGEPELGDMLYKSLFGRRYLIIMDDMWSIEAWNKVGRYFPDNNSGSGIIITSRLSKIAFDLTGGHGIKMNFLNEDTSWRLLCNIVFGEAGCPHELEKIGKKIAQSCKGLPLSLVVIGGLLSNAHQTREYWEYIAEDLNSNVNSEFNAHCLNLLYLSYNHLPVHLKPCFLYFGVFCEDREIRVSELIRLWAAEGFVKPIGGKSLEQVAEEYLRDLIDRNLVFVRKWKYSGKVKLCKIHDLLRDMCLREARKEKFLCATMQHNHNNVPHGLNTHRRIALHRNISNERFLDDFQSASDVRSFMYNFQEDLQLLGFRLLRVLKAHGRHSLDTIFSELVNLRFIAIRIAGVPDYLKFPSSVYLLWNLHTLIVGDFIKTILDIGKMPQLRHVKIWRLHLQHSSSEDHFVLENLQTLKVVENFRCSKRMVKRILNIKELKVHYSAERFIGSCYCLNNLAHLQELENLSCRFNPRMQPISRSDLLQTLAFPCSLKKLTLSGSCLHWEFISTKIGSLPLLQVLKLKGDSSVGPKWETVEERFCGLKFLEIDSCHDLKCWITDNTHFPCLEQLVLVDLRKLEEIPLSIGDIPTLQSIKIGNEDLQVQAIIRRRNEELQSLASNNFLVQVGDYYD